MHYVHFSNVYNMCINTQDKSVFKQKACQLHFQSLGFRLVQLLYSVGLKRRFCLHTFTQMQDCERLWWGEDGVLSASPRPTEPAISEMEIHRASSNRPRPWSSSFRITAWVRQSKYAYSNLLAEGSFNEINTLLNWDKVNMSVSN